MTSEKERLAAPIDANSNRITEGKSNGWSLIYCKGSEGEQLEFVQALGPVKQTFDNALRHAVGRWKAAAAELRDTFFRALSPGSTRAPGLQKRAAPGFRRRS